MMVDLSTDKSSTYPHPADATKDLRVCVSRTDMILLKFGIWGGKDRM